MQGSVMPTPVRAWGFANWPASGKMGLTSRTTGRATGRATVLTAEQIAENERTRTFVGGFLGSLLTGAGQTVQREQDRHAAEERQAAELALARIREDALTERARIGADRPLPPSPQFQVAPAPAPAPSGITGTQVAIGGGVVALALVAYSMSKKGGR